MLNLSDVLVLFVLLALGWFWSDGVRVRERALSACRAACRRAQVQLLDETVALVQMRLLRGGPRGLSLRRVYRFEFSVGGAERREGHVVMRGASLEHIHLDYPTGGVYEPGPGGG